ncbi:TIGR02221 family CRISPR-associated protein [Haloimpatiens sp. FM7330]|uniref:TIGR02221 family CRISPR-associated protein n=1 Tax=Haloimpatiens sp. FM7330 TaxID=3298610 RepID=UPI00362EDA2C
MGKKFFSVLGTTEYKPCFYKFKTTYETRYIQEALTKDICNAWNKEDEIIIFLTKEARKKHWYNKEVKEKRLSERLKQNCPNVKIKDVDIPSGKNEDEIWSIFEIILKNINEDDEIIFDITHSFRSIPMLVLVVLNYAKALKNIKLAGIYYGAYDAKVKKNGQEVAPVFDLTSFDNLLEWSEAVNSFLKYGNSKKIKELSTSEELIARVKEEDKSAIKIKNFVEKLNDFTNDIYTCRGKLVPNGKSSCKKSVATAYKMLKEKLDDISKEKLDDISKKENNLIKPLEPLFSKVVDRISEFSSDNNLKTGMAVIKWSIDNNLIQQGYTALDETIKTYLCKKYKLDDADYNNRENIINCSLNIKKESKNGKYKDRSNSIEQLIIEIADSWNIDSKYKNKVTQIANKIDDEIVDLCNKIREKRNDINHFGFRDNPADYNTMKNELIKCYSIFKNYVKKNSCECKE